MTGSNVQPMTLGNMRANGVRTMGFIGFADAYGDSWLGEIKRSAQTAGIKIVAEENTTGTIRASPVRC